VGGSPPEATSSLLQKGFIAKEHRGYKLEGPTRRSFWTVCGAPASLKLQFMT
jgi:hypothetical protein